MQERPNFKDFNPRVASERFSDEVVFQEFLPQTSFLMAILGQQKKWWNLIDKIRALLPNNNFSFFDAIYEKHFRSLSQHNASQMHSMIQSSASKICINKCYFHFLKVFQFWFKFVRKRKFQVADLIFFKLIILFMINTCFTYLRNTCYISWEWKTNFRI